MAHSIRALRHARWIIGDTSRWIQFVLSTPVVLRAGGPFFECGWRSIVMRHLNMFTLIAMESAGITLVKGDLRGIAKAIILSRSMMRNIQQNLFFAFAYNTVGILVAAGLLYPLFGLLLSSVIAGAAMSLSSVSVIANALRLRRLPL
jgi:cation transport ATPase